MKICLILINVIALLLILNCENPITGYGPQPNFIDKQSHKPMLNILGILRPETKYGYPLSFVHLEGTFSVNSEYPDTFAVKNAQVTVYKYKHDMIVDSIGFVYTDLNLSILDYEYRCSNFYPLPGTTYGISCKKEGYPEP